MKKLVFISAMFIVTVFANDAMAQSKMTEEQKQEARERYEAYQAKLNLTEEQQPKVEEINMTYFEGLSELKNSNASRLSKYRKFKGLSSARDKEMKEALDAGQYQIYKEFQADMREEFKERRKN